MNYVYIIPYQPIGQNGTGRLKAFRFLEHELLYSVVRKIFLEIPSLNFYVKTIFYCELGREKRSKF